MPAPLTHASDQRLKDNIAPLTEALRKVRALRGVSYTMKADGTAQIGLIAQEVLHVVPEAVSNVTGTMGVQYGNLVGLLVEAIKDMATVIDEQCDTIHGFNTRLSAIEAMLAGQNPVP